MSQITTEFLPDSEILPVFIAVRTVYHTMTPDIFLYQVVKQYPFNDQ